MTDLPAAISLREVGPRDGLQNEAPVPTSAKVELIDALSGTGVARIEAVSFVHPKAIPQMADADEVWERIARQDDVRYSALVPNLRGAQRALDASFTEIEVVVSASDTHNRKNVNRSTDESLDDIARLIEAVHAAGGTVQVIVSTAWGCPYEGDVPAERVLSVAGRAVRDGADAVSFGDTTGMATPGRVQRLVGGYRSAHPDVPLNLHFHNTRGTGLANVLAALQLGVVDFDASVGGLGGCPYAPGATGNVATEELVHMVEDMGVGDRRGPRGDDRRRRDGRAHRRPHPPVAGAARGTEDASHPAVSLVSVVVPFYNVAPYLADCLTSIATQTHSDLEVVMVDDGSTDGGAAIAERFAADDGRFRLVRQPNGGLGNARNTGVTHATGELPRVRRRRRPAAAPRLRGDGAGPRGQPLRPRDRQLSPPRRDRQPSCLLHRARVRTDP